MGTKYNKLENITFENFMSDDEIDTHARITCIDC